MSYSFWYATQPPAPAISTATASSDPQSRGRLPNIFISLTRQSIVLETTVANMNAQGGRHAGDPDRVPVAAMVRRPVGDRTAHLGRRVGCRLHRGERARPAAAAAPARRRGPRAVARCWDLLLADPKPGAPRLCRPADVSLERVRELVAVGQAESLTSEYKESFAQKIPDSVAAMANSYGGLILVGVTERKLDDRIIGFPSRRSFRSSAPATRSWNRRGSPRSSRCR
ncbi:AlbA family DNA-binding domain-containing protein [Streptomyces rhizoryzae]|uniref:AlbA family DNA-binding domain-containing protein n=1 Tax=Streptomyces rhizoryzae TaxID=2932493 RepID=UPI003556C6EA